MAILSKDGGAINLPADLLKDSSIPVTNTDQFQVVIDGLDPNKIVPIQFAWVYPDKTVSDYSPTYSLSTSTDPVPNTPALNNGDVEWANGYLKIVWNGNDSAGAVLKNYKQVNIWIRGGTFGATSVKTAHFFTGPGTKTIALPSDTYYVKLQTESALGKLSAFSNEIQASLTQKPSAVYNLTATWKKDDGVTKTDALRVAFTFDSTTLQNKYADYAIIKLTAAGLIKTFAQTINKSTTSNTWYLSASQNKSFFGLFQDTFTVEVYIIDTYGVSGDTTIITSESYTTPLDTPVITATAEIGGYRVDYNSQTGKPFDQVYIYEDTGSGYVQVAQGTSNPIRVGTLTYVQRSVKALFYDTNSKFTAYSNIVTVTPISSDTTDATPPGVPTVTAGTVTYNTIPITVTNADTTTKGHKVRYKKSTDTYYSTFDISSSGTSTSTTIASLSPNTVYNIGAASYDQFNNLSAFSTNINATTSTQTVSVPTSVILTGAAVGAIASWTAPASPVTPTDKYKVELYKTGTPDTLVVSEYTFSTTISFGGLTSGTYYVKVYTQDIYGVLSAAVQSANTTVTAGGSSDGVAPASSPTPTINSLYGALEVKWSPITNADTVTYEVHVSTTSGFTPSVSTKSIEVDGTFAIIKTLPGTSTALTYGTVYYVKLIAKDKDGSAAAGTQASGTPSQVDNGDLAANSVRANVIQAGTITGDKMVTDALFASQTINVGQSTSTNKITLSGVVIPQNTAGYSNPTSPIYGRIFIGSGLYSDLNTQIYLDNLGRFSLKDRLYFDGSALTVNGVINASSGNFVGAMTVNSGAMKFGTSAGGSGNDGIYINTNSYWYSSGNFAIGAATGSPAITWNGTALSVTGAINASSGTITGNFQVSTGTLTTGASATSGARVNVTSSGIFAYDATNTSPTTQIIGTATTAGTTFKTLQAELGNWVVDSTTIKNNGITLTAPNVQGAVTQGKVSIVANRGAYYVGMQTPQQTPVDTDIVLWAGQSSDGSTAPFKVTAGGSMTSTSGSIGGWTVGATSLSSSGMQLNSSNQTIVFTQGYTLDQTITAMSGVTATSVTGSSSTESDTPDSYYSSFGTATNSKTDSTLAIRPTSGSGGALTLSQNAVSGGPIAAKLSAGSSYITVTSSGLELNAATTGAYIFKGLTDTTKRHLTYAGQSDGVSEATAMVMIKSDGTLSVGRSIFKSGATETGIITNGTHNGVGRVGDIILSTSD